jgi:hypothetical protein
MISAAPSVARREHRTGAVATQECSVTQVVRWSGLPAVVRVKTPADVIVALPCKLPHHQAFGLARLVLDDREYAELRRKIKPPQPRSSRRRRTQPARRGR